MRHEHTANLFCAWCGRELGWRGGITAYTLCTECAPAVKAHYESTRNAARAGTPADPWPPPAAGTSTPPRRRPPRAASGG